MRALSLSVLSLVLITVGAPAARSAGSTSVKSGCPLLAAAEVRAVLGGPDRIESRRAANGILGCIVDYDLKSTSYFAISIPPGPEFLRELALEKQAQRIGRHGSTLFVRRTLGDEAWLHVSTDPRSKVTYGQFWVRRGQRGFRIYGAFNPNQQPTKLNADKLVQLARYAARRI